LNLAPKALVLKLLGRRIPDRAVLGAHYLMWLIATVVLVWYLIGG
jgi:fumarate reductase subunit C